ncbi:hypothetical protein [Bacillus velezensis]|nr:hypothetical protein [Bacillus velezensis]
MIVAVRYNDIRVTMSLPARCGLKAKIKTHQKFSGALSKIPLISLEKIT